MVKSYLRHGPTEAFSVINSASCRPVLTTNGIAYVPALEDVIVWDLKLGESIALWHETGCRALVTFITQCALRPSIFAVGYADGSIRIWDAVLKSVKTTLDGHKRQITALCFDEAGNTLASGSQDNDIILWDVVGETGQFRLVFLTCWNARLMGKGCEGTRAKSPV